MDIGFATLRNHRFRVKLEPCSDLEESDELHNITSALSDVFEEKVGKSQELQSILPLSTGKRFISVGDFEYSGMSFGYEKELIDYFGFISLLSDRSKDEVTRAFQREIKEAFRETFGKELLPTIQMPIEKAIKSATQALKNAFIVLPFDAASNVRARSYFQGKSADELFSDFKKNFCDSEQAVRVFINQRVREDLWQKLAFDDSGRALPIENIKQIYINIASIRYMCPICEGSYTYDIREKRDIQTTILRAILNAQGININKLEEIKRKASDLAKPLVIVYQSGIKPTSKG